MNGDSLHGKSDVEILEGALLWGFLVSGAGVIGGEEQADIHLWSQELSSPYLQGLGHSQASCCPGLMRHLQGIKFQREGRGELFISVEGGCATVSRSLSC